MIRLLSGWMCWFLTYLALSGQASADELLAGALCATSAVMWWVGIRRMSPHAFAFDSRALRATGRACRGLPWATLRVGAVLLRTLLRREGGEVVRQVFVRGRQADPHDIGRRAVVTLAASLAPDGFVLRMPMAGDEIIIHSMTHGASSRDLWWPI